MSRNDDGLPMLPPWLSESDVAGGYEAPVQNLPPDEVIDDAPSRRRRGRSAAPEGGRQDPNSTPGRKDKKRRLFGGRDKDERPEMPESPADDEPDAPAAGGSWSQQPPAQHVTESRRAEQARHVDPRHEQQRPPAPPQRGPAPTAPDPRHGEPPTGYDAPDPSGAAHYDAGLPTRQPGTPSTAFQPLGTNPPGSEEATTRYQRPLPDAPVTPPTTERTGALEGGELPSSPAAMRRPPLPEAPPSAQRPPLPEPPSPLPAPLSDPPSPNRRPPLPEAPPSAQRPPLPGPPPTSSSFSAAPPTPPPTSPLPGVPTVDQGTPADDSAPTAQRPPLADMSPATRPPLPGTPQAAQRPPLPDPPTAEGRPPLPSSPPTASGDQPSSGSGGTETRPDTGTPSRRSPVPERASNELDGPPPWLAPPGGDARELPEDAARSAATGSSAEAAEAGARPESEAPAWLHRPDDTAASRPEQSPPSEGLAPTHGDADHYRRSADQQRSGTPPDRPATPVPDIPVAGGDNRGAREGFAPGGPTWSTGSGVAQSPPGPAGYPAPIPQQPPVGGWVEPPAGESIPPGRHRLSNPEGGVGGAPDHRAPVSDQPSPGVVGRDPNVFAQPPADPRAPGWQQPIPQPPVGMPYGPPPGQPNPPAAPPNAYIPVDGRPGEPMYPPATYPPAAPPPGPGGRFPQGDASEPQQPPAANAPQWNTGAAAASWGQGQPPTGPHGQGQPSLDDVPLRRAKRSPAGGWRKAVHHVSGGVINPGMSAEEMRLQELVARIRQPVRGDYRIAVLSLKGGVGKTTTTMGLGSIFASIRGDRVIAVDANPDFGTLSQRVPLQTRSTVRDLLLDPSIERYSDVRRHTSQATSRLEVLASERDPAASESFNDEEYRAVARILQRFYNIILTDCGTGLMHSAMTGVLDLAHSLVLVSSAAIDGARSAAATLDWLSLHGHDHLVRNAVVVINLPREGSPNVGVQQLREYFLARCRAVHIIPYDQHLSEGAEIDLHRLSKQAKRAYVELSATVADEFGVNHRRYH
ncbi:AAA family ATPase [Nocardia aurea]|uniref:nucleotide-binding protein n=1 Tax=Nocardia aurea TaxID=2144174 RepID=UPI0033A1EB1E